MRYDFNYAILSALLSGRWVYVQIDGLSFSLADYYKITYRNKSQNYFLGYLLSIAVKPWLN
jgi:hypothetical protein